MNFIFLLLISSSFSKVLPKDTVKIINVAIGEWPPYVSKDLPDRGPHARLVSKIFKRLGYKVTYHYMPWKRALHETKKGKFVATFPWSKTKDRNRVLDYSIIPIANLNDRIYFVKNNHKDGIDIKNIRELKSLTAVAIRGYWQKKLYEKNKIKFSMVSNEIAAINMLLSSRADFYIEEEKVFDAILKKEFKKKGNLLGRSSNIYRSYPLYVLFSKKNALAQEVKTIFDKELKKNKKNLH